MKILPCHVLSGGLDPVPIFRQLNFLNRLSKGMQQNIQKFLGNCCHKGTTRKDTTESATFSIFVHSFFCLVHVLETGLTINTQKADL